MSAIKVAFALMRRCQAPRAIAKVKDGSSPN